MTIEAGFYLLKSADIGFVTAYLIVAFFLSYVIDFTFRYNFWKIENAKKSSMQIVWEVFFQVIISGIFFYIGRNVVSIIRFPFDNLFGLDHSKLKELSSGSILMMFLNIFQQDLQKKTKYYTRTFPMRACKTIKFVP